MNENVTYVLVINEFGGATLLCNVCREFLPRTSDRGAELQAIDHAKVHRRDGSAVAYNERRAHIDAIFRGEP